jgi:hypothetical protein
MLWIPAWLSVAGIGIAVFYDKVMELVPAPMAMLLFATWLGYAFVVTRFFELWCMRSCLRRERWLSRRDAYAPRSSWIVPLAEQC